MQRRLRLIDVFTTVGYAGNPVAVVLDGEGLEDAEMQRFAHWMNLSETTFVLPAHDAGADYRLRIFMPNGELPFAGHPTLGSCHAWLEAGGTPHQQGAIVQECGAGLVTLRQTAEGLAFAAPPLLRSGAVEEPLLNEVCGVLGIAREQILAANWVDNGPGWLAVELADADAVLAVRPGIVRRMIGIVGAHPPGGEAAFEVRAFFPKDGATAEDPVTGSLNASLAQWLLESGRVHAPYVVSQGAALGRAGRVHISRDVDDGTIWVAGGTVTCASGTVEL